MRRTTLYSSSRRSRAAVPPKQPGSKKPGTPDEASTGPVDASSNETVHKPSRLRKLVKRLERPVLVVAGVLVALLLLFAYRSNAPAQREITQRDIDLAVLRTLETKPMPSHAAKAYEVIRPSVVRVRGLGPNASEDEDTERGVGTGVIIVDKGTILTNLHVVAGAEFVSVTFADGTESPATVIGVRPEHDLAVLQPKTVPDDLVPATMRSTSDLRPGDEVVAVGFPFGIGPSVSAGVISGLRREFRSPQGKRVLTNLIQFDAAANPGSSGGPLVTSQGEVIGIVTAILNPTEQRVFVGIGFAVPIENAAGAVGLSPF
ncbi:MAG: S1C family serine protease [Betaproteobacteria bacterium]|nr:S1C family serine protease [Betaproteobacteria bacterium]